MTQNIRNIGIFAHVDAGKTTLTEKILAFTGAIRNAGSVDSGTTHTDTLPVERRRGISVKAACVTANFRGIQIQLIDTPGHADFFAEVERSLWALDAAVLVICAVEGVQPQTELLFHALREQKLPILFFINKTDRIGADVPQVLSQIKQLLTPNAALLSDQDTLTELLCDHNEDFFARYIEGEHFSHEQIMDLLLPTFSSGHAYPVLCGSALQGEGVETLLDAVLRFSPPPTPVSGLSGVVFAVQQDRALGRGVWIRMYGGTLANRDTLRLPVPQGIGQEPEKEYKVTQILSPAGKPVGRLSTGEIGIVYGLGTVPIGHILGAAELLPRRVTPGALRAPLIRVQVIPEDASQMQALHQACRTLADEDPLLHTQYIRSLGQLHMQVMGTIQLEILQELLQNRFDLNVSFSPPTIIYKETIRNPGFGFIAYTMPKPCWAILRFHMEPGPRGSGIVFRSQVPVRELAQHYQNQVVQALPTALSQGRLGWEVTDVIITLMEGNSHHYHTHPLDFIVATPMGIQDALQNCGSVLLEPILDATFLLPASCVGRIIQDVSLMGGEVLSTDSADDRMLLRALLPLRTSVDYPVTLAAVTAGRGAMSVRLHGYCECPPDVLQAAPRRGVDPLDTSKYILAARSALDGSIFDV